MTIEEIKDLPDERLNVMLAEIMGWEAIEDTDGSRLWHAVNRNNGQIRGYHNGLNKEHTIAVCFPRFCTDLNETAKVEAGIDEATFCNTYIPHLAKVCGFLAHDTFDGHKWSDIHSGRRAVVSAKARQRTIALILTLTK
jgi:hypothetical protein